MISTLPILSQVNTYYYQYLQAENFSEIIQNFLYVTELKIKNTVLR